MLISILLFSFVLLCLGILFLVLIQDPQGEGSLFSSRGAQSFSVGSSGGIFRFIFICIAFFLFLSFTLAWLNRSKNYDDVVLGAQDLTLGLEQEALDIEENGELWFLEE